jgi:AraC-like DNA-binding protein
LAAHIAAAAPAGQALALHAVARLQASGGAVRVETLAAALGVSRQYLGAQFRHHVGLSPKLFARICRFRAVRAAALAAQAGAPGHDWARLATDCGYFDQSHLIRDFHDFSGTSPGSHLDGW